MPPKKKGAKEPERPVLLGRASNHLSVGIVGLPNVGKSLLFNVLTKMQQPSSNFAFCTIDPCEAKVPVPDKRFEKLCAAYKPRSEVPAVLTVTDIAGLVRGAAEGAGLGNAFLSHIRAYSPHARRSSRITRRSWNGRSHSWNCSSRSERWRQ